MSNNKYEIDMCNGTIMDKLISFAIPLMVSSILQLLFNAVDLVVVGKFAGSIALAAVGSTTSLIAIFTNLFIGISMGANVQVARFHAAGKTYETSQSVHTAIGIAVASGFGMMVLGILLSRFSLFLMKTPMDVIDHSVLYLRIYFLGMPFFMLYNFGAAILRAVGDTKRPLYYITFSGVLNAGLNLFLVIVFHLGVAGVAIATVISQLISCILVLRCLCLSKTAYHLSLRNITIRWEFLKGILQVGIPTGFQSVIINFSNAMLQSSVNSFGSTAMAGYTAANNVFGFLYFSVNSITQACMSFTSQNFGVGKYKRMDRILMDCLILQFCIPFAAGCSVYLFSSHILGLYTTNPQAIAYGIEIFAYTTITYFLCGFMDLFPGAMRGMGQAVAPMILSILGTVGTRIVWILFIFPHYHTLKFLFISYPASWLITILMQVICYSYYRKKREL